MKFMGMFQHRVPLIAACLPIAFAIAACNQPPPAPAAASAPAATLAQTPTERGKMLVVGGLCHSR